MPSQSRKRKGHRIYLGRIIASPFGKGPRREFRQLNSIEAVLTVEDMRGPKIEQCWQTSFQSALEERLCIEHPQFHYLVWQLQELHDLRIRAPVTCEHV